MALTSERFGNVWLYRLDLPDVIDRARFIRGIVQVLLMEIANRNDAQRSAEVPLWLTEGLTQELLASREAEILLPTPTKMVNGLQIGAAYVQGTKTNSLEMARENLRGSAPLSFEQLSWPIDDQLLGDQKAVYSLSAEVFVDELLLLKDGKICLCRMLGELPHYYNWQMAFFKGFQASFQKAVDVEKWWSLRCINFAAHEPTQTWSFEASWQRLDQVLHPPVQIHSSTNDIPVLTEAPLQTVLQMPRTPAQAQVIRGSLFELELLRLRIDPRLAALVQDYQRVLEDFLQSQNSPGFPFGLRKKAVAQRGNEDAVKKLDLLDAKAGVLRHNPGPVAATEASTAPAAR
jgi:hypothetical protein